MFKIIFLLPMIGGGSLFTEKIASKVGDLVTVVIIEESYAKNRAETRADKRGSISAEAKQKGFPSTIYPLKHHPIPIGPSISGELAENNLHYGYGRHIREGKVKGFVQAKVVETFPNGNIKIVGEKKIHIGQDDVLLKVSGIARKEDIIEGNQILSTHLAEAKIEYSGKGVIDRASGKGFFRRICDLVWSPIALLVLGGVLYFQSL